MFYVECREIIYLSVYIFVIGGDFEVFIEIFDSFSCEEIFYY